MELLKSKKFKLPKLFFVEDRDEIKDIPIGIPFVYGNPRDKNRIIRMLEYEIIWKAAVKSGFPFNFKKLLYEAGFRKVKFHSFCDNIYVDHKDTGDYDVDDIISHDNQIYEGGNNELLEDYVEDCSALVDVDKLKQLNVFPVWLEDIEQAVETNVHNFAVYNPYMYNKKLEGVYGSIDMSSPKRNLFIFDWSHSIPVAISTTFITLGKHLAETFYADVILTASKSVFIPYEEVHSFNFEYFYQRYGRSQECRDFRNIVLKDTRHYNTVIVTGDNHSPCDAWGRDTKPIGRNDAKKMCKWTVDKMISMHTTNNSIRAGYGDFFDPKEIQHISDWVKYIK